MSNAQQDDVWKITTSYKLPRVILHEHSGQPSTCLHGLVEYAVNIASNKHTYAYSRPEKILAWLWSQPVKLDIGDGPKSSGCYPAQRSRIWPDTGLNCWEAVAHLLAVAFNNSWAIEYHIYDAKVGRGRHVFPAIRPIDSLVLPVPLVIQPPLRTGQTDTNLRLAQAEWYNDLLGGVHFVGDKVLRVFGQADLADQLAQVEADELPDWARTAKQKEQRAAELLKQAAEVANKDKPKEELKSSTTLEKLQSQIDALAEENRALRARIQRG